MSTRTYQCRECGNDFTVELKVGRPPIRCERCRGRITQQKEALAVKEKLSPEEIVDRLEMNLKAAGLHISQHRDKWE